MGIHVPDFQKWENTMGIHMYKVWINEMENKVYLYVNKCEVLKTLYLYKVSSRINLECNIHSLNSLNEEYL
jgi:hypothetical protein